MNMLATSTPALHVRLDTIGGRIRALRRALDMTVETAARRAGVSRISFMNWESGAVKNPDQKRLGAFCKPADVSLAWILEGKGPRPAILASLKIDAGIPEIAGPMSPDEGTPRAIWTIPHDVLQLGFNSNPGSLVIQRARGDYLLIDTSRNELDESGTYIVVENGVTSHLRYDEGSEPRDVMVLGRIMGVFRPT